MSSIDVEELASIQARVAAALESEPGVAAAEIARHRLAAAHLDSGAAARWAARAGREAMSAFAFDGAAAWFARAIECGGSDTDIDLDLAAGTGTRVPTDLPPGDYVLFCDITGHEGMFGHLTVTDSLCTPRTDCIRPRTSTPRSRPRSPTADTPSADWRSAAAASLVLGLGFGFGLPCAYGLWYFDNGARTHDLCRVKAKLGRFGPLPSGQICPLTCTFTRGQSWPSDGVLRRLADYLRTAGPGGEPRGRRPRPGQ